MRPVIFLDIDGVLNSDPPTADLDRRWVRIDAAVGLVDDDVERIVALLSEQAETT